MATTTLTPVTQLFSRSSKIVRDNLGIFIFINVLTILTAAWNVGTSFRDKADGSSWARIVSNGLFGNSDFQNGGSGTLIFVLFIATIVLWLMSVILTLRAASVKKLDLADVWAEFKAKGLRLLGVSIVVGLFIVGGFLLLIIPGIIILPRLILAPYLLVDQNTGIQEAINRSWDMTKGHSSAVWSVMLFGIVLSLAGVVPIIGALISTALAILYSVALPLRYFELKASKKVDVST